MSTSIAMAASPQLKERFRTVVFRRCGGGLGSELRAHGLRCGSHEQDYGGYQAASGRKVAVGGLIGLYGGLGLGVLGASVSEVSLERVRVSTWGGYGGAVVGLLLGAAVSEDNTREKNTHRGTVFGALAGLAVTFLTTSRLDDIPEEEPKRTSWYQRLTPTMVPMAGSHGGVHPGFVLPECWTESQACLDTVSFAGEMCSTGRCSF